MTFPTDASRIIDIWVADFIFGKEGMYQKYCDFLDNPADQTAAELLDFTLDPHYSSDMGAAWKIVELMSSHQGFKNSGFVFQGPIFTPDNKKFPGVPLGETGWYVLVVNAGRKKTFWHKEAPVAICLAAKYVIDKKLLYKEEEALAEKEVPVVLPKSEDPVEDTKEMIEEISVPRPVPTPAVYTKHRRSS